MPPQTKLQWADCKSGISMQDKATNPTHLTSTHASSRDVKSKHLFVSAGQADSFLPRSRLDPDDATRSRSQTIHVKHTGKEECVVTIVRDDLWAQLVLVTDRETADRTVGEYLNGTLAPDEYGYFGSVRCSPSAIHVRPAEMTRTFDPNNMARQSEQMYPFWYGRNPTVDDVLQR